MRNMQKTVLALVIGSMATTALAKSKDEDSVYSWGKWATLVKPAAGPQVPAPQISGLGVPGFGAGDSQQFTPMPIVPEEGGGVPDGTCAAGSPCGYALFVLREMSSETSLQAATPSLNPIPVENDSTTLAINSNTAIPLSLNITDTPVVFNSVVGDTVNWISFKALTDFVSIINGTTVDVAGVPFAYGNVIAFTGNAETGFSSSFSRFIVGDATGLDDLAGLNAGDVQATYQGVSQFSRTAVEINVDFGAGTWDGSWNGGVDSNIRTFTTSDGANVVYGQVGFEASGIVNGANIVGTSVSAADAVAISGTVDGTFFGGNAGVLGGVVNIDKQTAEYNGNYQDLFVTADPTKVTGVPGAVQAQDLR